MTTYINMTDRDLTSLNIRAELASAKEASCEFLGAYSHPEHRDQADWDIRLYAVTLDGYETRVADTNGDPVWEENDGGIFAELLEEYGVN